ncbi:neuromedin-B isoform X1 [Manis pentadactyla]|uniref:neuromedin-B isoform X1 n=1 Tax=Manis pentadactyla TaxID=143292 RepID=UPI00255C4370|nr:neuromedin-B isoform X1 [Manis pentadactyla]
MALRAEGARLLGGLLLFALLAAGTASPGFDLQEPRGRAGKIRVHPRGNLWATGHFMGKKSLEAPSPSFLGTAPQISLRARRLQRSHDLLGILLLKKAVGPGPGGPAPRTQHDAWRTESTQETGALASPRAPRQHLLLAHLLSPPWLTEAAGANAAEVMPLMRKIQQRGSDCAHPGKVLHGTLVGVPPGCKSWAQTSVTPFL